MQLAARRWKTSEDLMYSIAFLVSQPDCIIYFRVPTRPDLKCPLHKKETVIVWCDRGVSQFFDGNQL